MSSTNHNEDDAGNNTPPAAAAAAATSSNGDATLAQAMHAVESLIELYGFSPTAANEAVNVVGVDLAECCNYILEKGLGADQGGAVYPVAPCSHLVVADSKILQALEDNADNGALSLAKKLLLPNGSGQSFFETPCMYHHPTTTATATTTTTTTSQLSSTGKQKTDDPPPQLKVPGRLKSEQPQQQGDKESSCSHTGENWLCLKCGKLFCGRYVNGHGVRHWEEHPLHCVAVSLADLSVWCHECQSYLKTHMEPLQPLVRRLEELKFPETK